MSAAPAAIHLVAAHTLRLRQEQVGERARERFGGELRRAGSFAQLTLLGVQQCRAEAGPPGSLGMLWSSGRGAVRAARAALEENRRAAPVMPFAFIATQPHLAAALLARQARLARAAFAHVEPDGWSSLLHVARLWLDDCDEVLVGWVEEADDGGGDAASDWCLLRRRPAATRGEPVEGAAVPAAQAVTSDKWIERLAAWHAAPRGALELRAGGEAWRFSTDRPAG